MSDSDMGDFFIQTSLLKRKSNQKRKGLSAVKQSRKTSKKCSIYNYFPRITTTAGNFAQKVANNCVKTGKKYSIKKNQKKFQKPIDKCEWE